MVRFEIGSDGESFKPRRNPRTTDWETYLTGLRRDLGGSPPNISTREELEKAVTSLGEIVTHSFEASCPLKEVNVKRVPWWGRSLEDLRRKTRKALNKATKKGTAAAWNDYREARRDFKKELRQRKRTSWQEFCGEINSLPESARLMKVLSGEGREKIGSLKKEDGNWTTSSEESLELLLETHFPGEGAGNIATGPYADQAVQEMDYQVAEEVVTDGAITWAVSEFSPYKAAGLDGIFPALLQRGLDVILPWVRVIFRASLTLGHVPSTWTEARVVFIPKPGKKDYTAAKSFRPISLTSFLMKTLERMVNRYLEEKVLSRYPLNGNQHAYRKGKSTDTALHALVEKVEKSINRREVALAVFFDIEGAFDKARTVTICNALQARGASPTLVSWVRSALGSRRVRAILGDFQRDIEVRGGCQQGSCLSPLLWCLVMDSLLESLAQQDFQAQAYADDGVVIVSGRFLSTVCDRMQMACRIVQGWCTETGLSVNPTKTELVLFSRRRKLEGFRAPTMYGRPLALSREVKYLGVILDSKLTWRSHVDRLVSRSTATF
nr:unnamed protein product [Callosobruchus chinensis]